jgi:NADP-dependent 3-hydroxy acid dehydrogenase YdfG
MQVSGRVGIITGATSGIGWETAKLLSEAGASLVTTGRRRERLDQLVGEMAGDATPLAADIADPDVPRRLIETAIDKYGKLDFVFSNAGVMNIGSVDQYDDEAYATMIRVNYEAAVRMAYAAIRVFKPQGHGDLITTSSILGLKVRPTVGVYAGTKYAVEAMAESLRMELAGTGVRVMVIEPGYTSTNLQGHWNEDQKEMLKAIREPLQPIDIARAVKFMLEQPANVVIPRLLMVPGEQLI